MRFMNSSIDPSVTHREVLRTGGEEAVVEWGEGEVCDELGVGVDERHFSLGQAEISLE